MKIFYPLILGLFISLGLNSAIAGGNSPYPAVLKENYAPKDLESTQEDEEALSPYRRKFEWASNKFQSNRMLSDEDQKTIVSQTLSFIKMKEAEIDKLGVVWPVVEATGRMPLPQYLIQKAFWFPGMLYSGIPGQTLENDLKARYLVREGYLQLIAMAPREYFHELAKDAKRPGLKTSDILKLNASIGYQMQDGSNLAKDIDNSDWQALYSSSNSVFKIIAFEKYDSTDLTPPELLKVYQEGLFNSCSYVEMRILAGIYASKDYRPEVIEMVSNYLAANPLEDDGTLLIEFSGIPMPFQSLKDGAQKILDEGREKLSQQTISKPVPTSSFGKTIDKSRIINDSNKKVESGSWKIGLLIFGILFIGYAVLRLYKREK